MRAITRRLRLLEAELAPRVNPATQRPADILAERQRAGGHIHEPLDRASLNLPPGTHLNCRETLRLANQLRRERDRQRRATREGDIVARSIPA